MKKAIRVLLITGLLTALSVAICTFTVGAKEYTGSVLDSNMEKTEILWTYDDQTQILTYKGNGKSVLENGIDLEDVPEGVYLTDQISEIVLTGIQKVKSTGYRANIVTLGEEVEAYTGEQAYLRFQVDGDNPYLSTYDGALYSKDYSELFRTPSRKTEIHLHPDLETIKKYAFFRSSFRQIVIPWGVTTLEDGMFVSLESWPEGQTNPISGISNYIVIPDTVKNFGQTERYSEASYIYSENVGFDPLVGFSVLTNSWEILNYFPSKIQNYIQQEGLHSFYDFYGITPNSFKTFGSKTYYFDADCKMVTGTKTIGNVDYTFDANGVLQSQTAATVKSGLVYQDGKAYYYESGIMQKSKWVYADGNWYYLNDYGAGVVNCWRLSGGKYFYLGADGKMKTNSWIKDYGNWYYVKADGSRYESSWAKINGAWYWFGGSGKMAESQWLKLADGKWYYFTGSGAMAANRWVKSGSYWYYLGKDGAMLTSTVTPDGYKVDAEGRWR